MSIRKKLLTGVVLALLLFGGVFAGFWYTGGKSLVFVYRNYLAKDIPEKQYNYKDFTDRCPREMLHGYYGWADSSGFYIWTLSGLKRFTHKQDMSVYYYMDTCATIKQIESGDYLWGGTYMSSFFTPK